MDLYLRKVIHNQAAPDGYRVVLKNEYGETEIFSIGLQHGAGAQYFWKWAIDTVIPMRASETSGRCKDRADCMRQFKEAWARFCLDDANLTMFMAEKRRRASR
jgi:hypothetical protein